MMEEKLFSYLNERWPLIYVVSSEMCHLKVVVLVKEIGIQGFSMSHGCWSLNKIISV
jgi:hypothetical protein